MGVLDLDVLLTVAILLIFFALKKADIGLNEFYKDTYTRYVEHLHKQDLVQPSEWLFIILMAVNVAILYAYYRLREYGRMQSLSQLNQKREYVALFRQETEFINQLRAHGIVFEDPRKVSPGLGGVRS